MMVRASNWKTGAYATRTDAGEAGQRPEGDVAELQYSASERCRSTGAGRLIEAGVCTRSAAVRAGRGTGGAVVTRSQRETHLLGLVRTSANPLIELLSWTLVDERRVSCLDTSIIHGSPGKEGGYKRDRPRCDRTRPESAPRWRRSPRPPDREAIPPPKPRINQSAHETAVGVEYRPSRLVRLVRPEPTPYQ